jgi:hypothetical protein
MGLFAARPRARHRAVAFAALVALLLLAALAWWGLTGSDPAGPNGRGAADAPADAVPWPGFEDVTAAAGIDYTGMSYGAAWGDWDGDGFPDLWASGHSPQRLLHNQRDGGFVDITADSVAPIRYADRHNAAWADLDNDGRQDLAELSGAGRGRDQDPNTLYRNLGGRLVDQAAALGVDYPLARGRAPLWLDVDNDGRLDLLMTAAPREEAPPAVFRWAGTGFARQFAGFITASESALLTMLGSEPELHLLVGPPHELQVFALRDGALVPIGPSLGLTALPGHWVTDVLAADLDNDLRPDLVFVRGDQDAAFMQPAPARLSARLRSMRGQAAGLSLAGPSVLTIDPFPRGLHWWGQGRLRIGADGQPPGTLPVRLTSATPANHGLAAGTDGLFIGFDPEAERWLVELRAPEWDEVNLELRAKQPIDEVQPYGFNPEQRRVGQFIQWHEGRRFGPASADILGERNCFGGAAADFDNDMDLDLYLVCGDNLANADNLFFENLGQRRFRLRPDAAGAAGSRRGQADSVAVADYDLDGWLDLFVRNGRGLPPFANGPDQLFRNLGNANHWVQFDLQGTASNRDGIGARVILSAGGVRQLRIADNGSHGRVQHFRRLHFGLGRSSAARQVRVEWPSGAVTEYRDVPAGRIWVLREDGAMLPHPAVSQPRPASHSNSERSPAG